MRNKQSQPRIKEGTNTAIQNIIEREENRTKTEILLKKCKQRDKGKKLFQVPGCPVKTWFLVADKSKAEKRIKEFKKSLIVKS